MTLTLRELREQVEDMVDAGKAWKALGKTKTLTPYQKKVVGRLPQIQTLLAWLERRVMDEDGYAAVVHGPGEGDDDDDGYYTGGIVAGGPPSPTAGGPPSPTAGGPPSPTAGGPPSPSAGGPPSRPPTPTGRPPTPTSTPAAAGSTPSAAGTEGGGTPDGGLEVGADAAAGPSAAGMGGDTTGAAATGSGSDGGRRLDGAVVGEDEEYYDAGEIAEGLIAPPADPTLPGDPRPVADGGDSGDADSVYADAVGDEEGDFARRLIGGQGASTAADTATSGQNLPPSPSPTAIVNSGNASEPVADGQNSIPIPAQPPVKVKDDVQKLLGDLDNVFSGFKPPDPNDDDEVEDYKRSKENIKKILGTLAEDHRDGAWMEHVEEMAAHQLPWREGVLALKMLDESLGKAVKDDETYRKLLKGALKRFEDNLRTYIATRAEQRDPAPDLTATERFLDLLKRERETLIGLVDSSQTYGVVPRASLTTVENAFNALSDTDKPGVLKKREEFDKFAKAFEVMQSVRDKSRSELEAMNESELKAVLKEIEDLSAEGVGAQREERMNLIRDVLQAKEAARKAAEVAAKEAAREASKSRADLKDMEEEQVAKLKKRPAPAMDAAPGAGATETDGDVSESVKELVRALNNDPFFFLTKKNNSTDLTPVPMDPGPKSATAGQDPPIDVELPSPTAAPMPPVQAPPPPLASMAPVPASVPVAPPPQPMASVTGPTPRQRAGKVARVLDKLRRVAGIRPAVPQAVDQNPLFMRGDQTDGGHPPVNPAQISRGNGRGVPHNVVNAAPINTEFLRDDPVQSSDDGQGSPPVSLARNALRRAWPYVDNALMALSMGGILYSLLGDGNWAPGAGGGADNLTLGDGVWAPMVVGGQSLGDIVTNISSVFPNPLFPVNISGILPEGWQQWAGLSNTPPAMDEFDFGPLLTNATGVVDPSLFVNATDGSGEWYESLSPDQLAAYQNATTFEPLFQSPLFDKNKALLKKIPEHLLPKLENLDEYNWDVDGDYEYYADPTFWDRLRNMTIDERFYGLRNADDSHGRTLSPFEKDALIDQIAEFQRWLDPLELERLSNRNFRASQRESWNEALARNSYAPTIPEPPPDSQFLKVLEWINNEVYKRVVKPTLEVVRKTPEQARADLYAEWKVDEPSLIAKYKDGSLTLKDLTDKGLAALVLAINAGGIPVPEAVMKDPKLSEAYLEALRFVGGVFTEGLRSGTLFH